MKISKAVGGLEPRSGSNAFTLVETVVGVFLGSIMFSALYACFAVGFRTIDVTREDLKATQILVARMEAVRLCTFAQITNPTNNPAVFTDYFDSKNKKGCLYKGTFTATVPAVGTIPEGYRTDMLLVTVGVKWDSAKITRTRSMQTYVARQGTQSYVAMGK